MVQSSGVPRFNEDSALKKHWPLLWITALSALIFASFVADFNVLRSSFEDQNASRLMFGTSYNFKDLHIVRSHIDQGLSVGPRGGTSPDLLQLKLPSSLTHIVDKDSPLLATRHESLAFDGEKFAERITSGVYASVNDSKDSRDCYNYLRWFFHRRMGLLFVDRGEYQDAEIEFSRALDCAKALGTEFPCRAITLSESALLANLRAVEMQQVAQMLLRAALPIFSFLAAVLPFALFLTFVKSRDKQGNTRENAENAGMRLFLKSIFLSSWFGVIVTGWVALRNYGMGLAAGWTDPAALSLLASLGALLLTSSLMLRYMPPYKSISLKRTMVGFGFNGILLLLKAVAIYLTFCLSLAGHPALKDVLFCESMYTNKAAEARILATQAITCTRKTVTSDPFLQEQLASDMSQILLQPKTGEIDRNRASDMRNELRDCADVTLALPANRSVPYLWGTTLKPYRMGSYFQKQPVSIQQMTVGMTLKACLAYLLFFYPECLAYLLLGFRQHKFAIATFNRAVRIKEYFLGVNHWLVISMMELFGSCLLTFHKKIDLSAFGEEYLRDAIARYERSRGRHDQLTIAAKMSLAKMFSNKGDDKQAEKILLEALRDVGKDFDILAYCALLSELGSLFSRRSNYSKSKQMYKQVIDLLEERLAKCPPCQGFMGYVRNIYATIPTWQMEVKLVYAYLDLAAVFQKATYNGEAQRLTEDASKRISAFEKDAVVFTEVGITYYKARTALAQILCQQGRYDECLKLLAATKKQIGRWGYSSSLLFFEFAVLHCEIELIAGKALPKYFEIAKKDYMAYCGRYGFLGGSGELRERWHAIGEKLGVSRAGRLVRPAANVDMAAAADPGLDMSLTDWFTAQASNKDEKSAPAKNAALPAAKVASKQPEAPRSSKPVPSAAKHSKVIEESRETEDEGIIIRWQRERKDELMFELRPERS